MTAGSIAFNALIVAICIFILAPIAVVLVASISTTPFLSFPPAGFTFRWFEVLAEKDQLHLAVKNSLIVAASTAVMATTLAIFAARASTRHSSTSTPRNSSPA